MERYKTRFIRFIVECRALRFGSFMTKSGRRTPYFIDTGQFNSGAKIRQLGRFYADALEARLGGRFDVLFGPAYKGIPLAAATAIALHDKFGRDVGFAFNRKEAKGHGEGGTLIGHAVREGERVVILDDVVTAGTSVREAVKLLRAAARIKPAGLVVSVDRQERGTSRRSALDELRGRYRIDAFAIVTLDEIVRFLFERPLGGEVLIDQAMMRKIEAYRGKYGA